VLEALLRRKLRRPGDADDDEVGDYVVGREDPLTSSVFERLAYLPVPVAWALIGSAVRSPNGARWPDAPPLGEPDWRFWPSLRPAPTGRNVRRVEPDVVLGLDDHAILFEMKHWGVQSAAQWTEQVLAARHAGFRAVMVVAVGGRDVFGDRDRVAAFNGHQDVPLFTLSWGALREAVASRIHAHPSHERRVLRDVERALDHWGYGPPRAIHTLAEAHAKLLDGRPVSELGLMPWQPSGVPSAGPVDDGLGRLATFAKADPLGPTSDLSAWSLR
jgi:hypothetical protein